MKPNRGDKKIIQEDTKTQFPIIDDCKERFLFFTESEEYFRGIEEEAGL